MQTLTAGSFLNLENAENVEALKHTARRLAGHTATVVRENLQPGALENLALNLWEKAEYVTRETERQRLRQIFVENFGEQFRELKPVGVAQEEKSASEVPATNSSKEFAPAVEGGKDEFWGFVKTDEPPGGSSAQENNALVAGEPEKIEQSAAQSVVETTAETAKPENQSNATGEASNLENQIAHVAGQTESAAATQDSDVVKTEATVAAGVAPHVKSKPHPVAATGGKTTTQTPNEKEPFEFGKCTVNLNLVLLPRSGDAKGRKVIASAVSHNLPPEIDFLEIADGEDLMQIADLVRDKLARFKQSLPAKYIEQLRASKTNRAKSGAVVTKATAAAPTQAASSQADAEKTSGGRENTPETNRVETEKQQSALPKENNPGALSPPVPTVVNRPGAANDVQQSLF